MSVAPWAFFGSCDPVCTTTKHDATHGGNSQGNSGIRILTARQARGVFLGHAAQYVAGDDLPHRAPPVAKGDHIGNALQDIGIVADGRQSSRSECCCIVKGLL